MGLTHARRLWQWLRPHLHRLCEVRAGRYSYRGKR